MSDDWGAVRGRLGDVVEGKPYEGTYCVTNLRADIRAALEENARLKNDLRLANHRASGHQQNHLYAEAAISRLTRERDDAREEARLNRAAAEKHYAYGEAQKELAEAAEAKLAEATIKLRLLPSEAAWQEGARMLQEADRARQWAEAKLARCVEALEMIVGDGHETYGGGDEPEQCKPCCAACHAVPALAAAKGE